MPLIASTQCVAGRGPRHRPEPAERYLAVAEQSLWTGRDGVTVCVSRLFSESWEEVLKQSISTTWSGTSRWPRSQATWISVGREHIQLSANHFNNYLQELLANFQNSIFLSCKTWPLHLPNPFLATRWLLAVKSQCNSTRGAGGLAGLWHLLQPDPGGSQQCPAWSNVGQPRSGSRPQPPARTRPAHAHATRA